MQTFRHDFGEKFIHELEYFATIHKHDDRKSFKSEWEKWIKQDDIRLQIDEEIKRLKKSGYEGDVLDKMFKSARYYFRKKVEKPEENQRKKYVSLCPQFLAETDDFISELFESEKVYSPASAYEIFCKTKKDIIAYQVQMLVKLNTGEDICLKLKKNFKNRFYTRINEIKINSSPDDFNIIHKNA